MYESYLISLPTRDVTVESVVAHGHFTADPPKGNRNIKNLNVALYLGPRDNIIFDIGFYTVFIKTKNY